jgi:surface protein
MGVNSANRGYIGNNQSDYLSGTLNSRTQYLDEEYLYSEYNDYVRPSQWVSLPGMTAGTQMVAGVYAIYDNDSNFLSLSAATSTGNYVVDWGDGTTSSASSFATVNKQYTRTTYAGLTSSVYNGYKTLVITIRPITGNLTGFDFYTSMASVTVPTNIRTQRTPYWLDIRVAGSNINYFSVRNCQYLEQFEFVGSNNLSSIGAYFWDCFNLQKIVQFDTSKVSAFNQAFAACRKLKTVPLFNTSNATNMVGMFTGCRSLIDVPLFDTSKATDINNMFADCLSLVTIPPFNTANVTTMGNMFGGARALKKIPLLNTSKVTDFNNMFISCLSLQYIPQFDTSNGTNFYRMFYNSGLKYFPKLNLSKATSVSGMFHITQSLEKVEDLNTPLCTDFSFMFYSSNINQAPNLDTSNATLMNQMFGDTPNIRTIPNYNTSKVTNFSYMFLASGIEYCGMTISPITGTTAYTTNAFEGMFDRSLIRRVDNIDVSGVSSGSAFNNIFAGMFTSSVYPSNNLTYVGVTGIKHNFEVRNSMMGPTALNDLYTSLATVGASGSGTKTIVVSGCWGASAGLGHNPSIAINKGWTVTT